MNRKVVLILLAIFSFALAGELVFLASVNMKNRSEIDTFLENPVTEPTEPETEAPTTAPTETQPEETEPPVQNRFVLTFTGDCTLGSTAASAASPYSFVGTVGTDYDYPFANVAEYFENDDFTIINLEGPLTDTGTAAAKTFAFKGPTAYTQILTGSSVEAVTLANNHSEDYGTEGYESTRTALENAGVTYVERDKSAIYETEGGLTIGLYAASFTFDVAGMTESIQSLRSSGADIVICAFHWGVEGAYRPSSTQEYYGKIAIDAGADIVYGNHPHVLQKVEQYQNGYIFYSLGNFSFGGSNFPQDYDGAILQMEVLRDEDGTFSLGELTMIPVSVSSMEGQNNFQPTPYDKDTAEYDRAISKLKGTFTGSDLLVNYGTTTETTPTETTPAKPAPTDAPATEPETPKETVPPATTGGSGGITDGSFVPEPDSSNSGSSGIGVE